MRIKWNNILALAMVTFAVVIAVGLRDEIRAFLGTMAAMGPGHEPQQQMLGLIAFSLLIVTLVAIVAICRNTRGDDR